MENTIGKNIAILQEMAKLSKKDFANKYEIKDTTFSSYIYGRSIPPMDLLIAICDGEGVSLDWLCGRSHDTGRLSFSEVIAMLFKLNQCSLIKDMSICSFSCSDGTPSQASIGLEPVETTEEDVRRQSHRFFQMLARIAEDLPLKDVLNQEQYDLLKKARMDEYSTDFL